MIKKLGSGSEAYIGVACGLAGCMLGDFTFAVGAGAATSLGKFSDHINSNQSKFGLDSKKTRDKIRKAVLAAYNQQYANSDKELKLHVEVADKALAEALGDCALSRDELVQAANTVRVEKDQHGNVKAEAEFEVIAVDMVMEKLGKAAPNHFAPSKKGSEAYAYAQHVVHWSITEVIRNADYFRQIEAKLEITQAGGLAEIAYEIKRQGEVLDGVDKKVDELKDGQEEIKALIRQTMAEKHIMPPEELRSPDFFVKLSNAHDAPLNELLGLVSDVLKKDVNPQNFGQMLDLAKKALVVVKTEFQNISHLSNEVPEIKPFLDNARAALENDSAIDLDEAKLELRAARREYDARVEKRHNEEKQNSAEMIVLEAQMAQAQSNIDEAAGLYDQAIAKVAHHLELRQTYLWDKASMLYEAGILSAEPDWLKGSIKARQDLLKISDRQYNANYWAKVQNNLGNALQGLGLRQSDDGLLKEAIGAYREALQEYTRERVPLEWATLQNNLGAALRELGSRQSDDGLLREAIVAFRAALQERTRKRVPLDWAMTQNNLGNALRQLGLLKSDDELLREGIDAYRAALQEWPRERVPLDWAKTQNNLGSALLELGLRQSDDGLLKEAIDAYRVALQERTRERVPLDWAMTQNNLGAALASLSTRQSDDGLLRESIDAFRTALQERTRERVPLDWANTQHNLGNVLGDLAELTEDEDLFLQAIQVYELALEERREDNAPHYHQQTKDNLAITKRQLAAFRAKKHGAR